MDEYQTLLAKIDAKFSEIRRKHPNSFACKAGCHSCCQPGLSVSRIERDNIREHLAQKTEILNRITSELPATEYQGNRCFFLNHRGECSIYNLRPVICRSHGAPIRFKSENADVRDVCPKNFSELNIDEISDEDFLNIDLINTILAMAGKLKYGEADAGARYRLTLSGILTDDPISTPE